MRATPHTLPASFALAGAGEGLRLKVRRTSKLVPDLESASAEYAKLRDASGEGASTFPCGQLTRDGLTFARLSYNAKVWIGDECVYSPYGDEGYA